MDQEIVQNFASFNRNINKVEFLWFHDYRNFQQQNNSIESQASPIYNIVYSET